ncbi:MAG: hypothetical protein UY80_C0021G0012 [Parcubacteria group bacterium GW2011_GWB1_53_43]|nr:MAG: hypothetical protein UY80_C0021G0012 [Parcubacteria group bacterium GW2011_GWB1_53_43]
MFWVFLQHRKHPPLASGTQNAVVGKVYPTEKVNTRGDGFEYDFKVNGVLITLTELVSKEDAGRCRFIEYDNITNINLGDNPLI